MRVLLAPDKFKGSLSAVEVARHLAAGLRRADPGIEVTTAPVGDGGDGTLEAFLSQGYEARRVTVRGTLGRPRTATYAVKGDQAVVELAEADGLRHLGPAERDPRRATSYGVGELVLAALDAGCHRVVLALGGSANTDGGAGMVQALGGRLLDRDGAEIGPGGEALLDLARLDVEGLDPRLGTAEFVVASDVDNPLLGPEGAAAVYAPQKGADRDDVDVLERGLGVWAAAVRDVLGEDHATSAGAGAAGGVGFAAMAFLGATLRPGIDIVLDALRFDELLAGADAVVTGEGSLDRQSLRGKAPVGVAAAAARQAVPAVAVAGRNALSAAEAQAAGFVAVLALADREPDVAVCMREAGRLLEDLGPELLDAVEGAARAR